MPYSLSRRGQKMFSHREDDIPVPWHGLTDMQKQALEYAMLVTQKEQWDKPKDTFGAADVATYYKYPNGQYFRGVLASLHKKGLLDKHEEM